jgi:UDP-N-acetylmuramyl tripeptide synthase
MDARAQPSPRIEDSRRLLGPNRFHDEPGALLELRVGDVRDAVFGSLLDAHVGGVRALHAALGWPDPEIVVDQYAGDLSVFVTAPLDQLLTATDVNELAWLRAERTVLGEGVTGAADDGLVPEALAALRDREAAPRFVALHDAARARGLDVRWDDASLWLGAGHRGLRLDRRALAAPASPDAPLPDALPAPDDVPWAALANVPTALVTGTNGKTTTVRMLAAILRAAGHVVGRSTTDAVLVGDDLLETGDLSGPHGARLALGDPRATAAVLETARGGILRRGLAMRRADVAIVTTLAADHLGTARVHTLAELADVKLTVGRALGHTGVLVVNAENAALRERASGFAWRLCWIARDGTTPAFARHVREGGLACVVRDGAIVLHDGRAWRPIVDVAAIPATLGGAAWHNVVDALCAVAAAHVLGVDDATIARALSTFGADPADNTGRLMRLDVRGVTVLVDYAHNAQSVRALADVAHALPAARRAIVLGTGGDRDDAALADMAREAARRPRFDRYVAKDTPQVARGRAADEVSGVLAAALVDAGVDAARIVRVTGDLAAARDLLAWARPGDLLALAVHAERDAVLALLADAAEGRDGAG